MAACVLRLRMPTARPRCGGSWGSKCRSSQSILRVLPQAATVSKRFEGTTAAAKSNQPPLLLSFKRGKYKLNLPLLNGSVVASAERCTAFSFHPSHSLGTVKTSIREEGVSEVEFSGPNGEQLPDESTVGDAAWYGGFEMTLDGKHFPVLATRSGGYVDDEEEGGGRTELPSLLERGRVLRLRAALEDETRRSMTYAEFESLCEDCGMDEADARKVAADLHKVGVLLHFHNEPGLMDIVYLQPHQVLEHFFAKYSLESPLQKYLLQKAEALEAEKAAVRRELDPTMKLKETLDEQVFEKAFSMMRFKCAWELANVVKFSMCLACDCYTARRTVSRCMWGISGAVVSGAGGYWYLSYVYLSWDIMEPVTFFTALGVSTLSYAWWMFTNKEYQYSNMFEFFFNSMIKRRYKTGGLDEKRLAEAEEEFEKLESKGKLLQARIFELECMRDKGLTAAEAAGIVADNPGDPTAAFNGRPPSAAKAD